MRQLIMLIDLLLSCFTLIFVTAYVGLCYLCRSRGNPSTHTKKLLVVQTFHTYAAIKKSGHEEMIYQTDLDGFFDQVYTLYPTVGSDTGQPTGEFSGNHRITTMNARHEFIEYKMAALPLKLFPTLNFILSQTIMLRAMQRFTKKHQINLVRGTCPFLTGLYAMLIARQNNIPYSLRIGGNYDLMHKNGLMVYRKIFRRYWVAKKIAHWVFRNADNVCAVNNNNLQYCLNNGAKKEKCVVIRYGNMIDPIHYTEPKQRQGFLKTIGIDPHRPITIYVGRLTSVKHPEDLLTITKLASKILPNMLTIVIGNGDVKASLEQQAKQMNIENNIVFLGHQNQEKLAQLYVDANVYLSTLTGRSLVEAALAELPMLAYDYEWHSEMVIPDKTGELAPYRDTQAMAQQLIDLLQNPDRAKKLGQQARLFTLDLMDKGKIRLLEQQTARALLKE